MKAILSEYVMLIVSILIVGVFLFLWEMMTSENSSNNLDKAFDNAFCWSDENLIQHLKYNGGDYYTLDTSSDILDVSDKLYGVDNIVLNLSQPYFKVDDNKDYIIKPVNESTKYQKWTKSDALQGVSACYRDKNGVEHQISDITVLVTEYIPKTINDGTGEYVIYDSSTILMEEMDATDKYGRYLIDGYGERVKTTQIVYDDGMNYNVDNFASNGLQVDNDIPKKYKVVYRVQYGSLKAQYTAIFLNQTRNRDTEELIYETYSKYYGG